MNILLIILLVIMIWRIAVGAKRGLVKELLGLINLMFVSLILMLAFMIYRAYVAGTLVSILPMAIAIVILSIIYAIVKLVFSPAKLVAKLPLVKSVDKILGIVIGAAEVIVVYWILCCVIKYTNIAALELFALPYINGNAVLANLYQHNLLEQLIVVALNKIAEVNVLDFIQS